MGCWVLDRGVGCCMGVWGVVWGCVVLHRGGVGGLYRGCRVLYGGWGVVYGCGCCIGVNITERVLFVSCYFFIFFSFGFHSEIIDQGNMLC